MGFSLGWHIILACFGVGLPALVVFVEWRGLRTGESPRPVAQRVPEQRAVPPRRSGWPQTSGRGSSVSTADRCCRADRGVLSPGQRSSRANDCAGAVVDSGRLGCAGAKHTREAGNSAGNGDGRSGEGPIAQKLASAQAARSLTPNPEFTCLGRINSMINLHGVRASHSSKCRLGNLPKGQPGQSG
jgi:hypothetical protein